MSLDAVNTKFYSFIFYFILFTNRWLQKTSLHCSFYYKMFQHEDDKEQDVSIIGSRIAKSIFFSILKLLTSWLAVAFFNIFVCFGVANMST